MSKRKTIIISIISLILIVVSSFTIYAAYYGRGIFKDVFVNREYYFTSNTLKRIDTLEEAPNVSLSSKISYNSDRQSVSIYNYNPSSGEFQSQDIKFTLYAWIDKDFEDPSRNYEITISDVADPVILNNSSERLTTEMPTPIATDLELAGNQLSTVTITLDYNLTQEDDVTLLPSIILAAKVDSPKFMNNRVLGGKFIASRGEEFALDKAEFVKTCLDKDTTACTTKEYAAFVYEVSCIGNPKATDKLVISFDADVISLDQYNEYYRDNLEVKDGLTIIEIIPTDGYTARFTFFRNITSDIWESEKDTSESWTDLASYITTTMVREEE